MTSMGKDWLKHYVMHTADFVGTSDVDEQADTDADAVMLMDMLVSS